MLPFLCPDEHGRSRFDCDRCEIDAATRRVFHCGRLPEEEWAEVCELPESFRVGSHEVQCRVHNVCPGHLVRSGGVVEAAQAYGALKVGELSTVFPDPDNAVVEGALAVQSSFARWEAASLKERSR